MFLIFINKIQTSLFSLLFLLFNMNLNMLITLLVAYILILTTKSLVVHIWDVSYRIEVDAYNSFSNFFYFLYF